MKSFLLSLAAIVLIQTSRAMEPITTFNCSYFGPNQELTIKATPIYANGTFNLDIPLMSYKGEIDQVYLRIPSKKIQKFVAELQEAKNIYVRWTNAAKENNVTELAMKEMPLEMDQTAYEARFLYGEWHFSYREMPVYAFRIDKDGFAFIIALTHIQSSSNRYIKSDGGLLVFTSVEEIDDFIKCMDPQLVIDHYANKESEESIFN